MIMRQWIFFIIMGCSVCACKQDIDLYEGNSSIYLDDNSAGVYDISWSTYDSDVKKMTVQLQVNLSGMVKDYPRKFNIEVISSETDSLHSVAGVDYTPLALEYEMPALANHMYIDVELLRTDTLLKQARRFTIQLVPNEELGFEFMKYGKLEDGTLVSYSHYCVIYMHEEFPRPWWWSRVGEPIFGEWSVKKGILICDVGNIDRALFQGEIDSGNGNLTSAFLRFIGRKVHLWLLENPTMDEDDELMEMGEDSIY